MVQLIFLKREKINLSIGIKYTDSNVISRMPKIGDVVIKDRGEVKENYVITEEHEHYFLGVAERLKFKECFSKVGFALGEFKIRRRKNEN